MVLIPHSIAFWSGWNVAGAASYGPEVTLEDIWYLIAVFFVCSFYCSVLLVHDFFLKKT